MIKVDARYELEKARDKTLLWLAGKVPTRLAYWVYVDYGMSRIRDEEVVPEVRYAELLGRPHR
jgi:hypothetical protein